MTKEEFYRLSEGSYVEHDKYGKCLITNVVKEVGVMMEPQTPEAVALLNEDIKFKTKTLLESDPQKVNKNELLIK